MKKLILVFIFVSCISYVFAGCKINCNAHYLAKVYHPPTYYEGSTIGRILLTAGYYEDVWSETYHLTINFYSGYEINEEVNKEGYSNNSIYALINWNNGGHTLITIQKWTTNLKYITKEEVEYDNAIGTKISKLTGYDFENRYWELFL
jgi:hypothetical protein